MEPLSRQRCIHHGDRQAVARCPGCHQFYCRECITEHDDRVLCASCLKTLTHSSGKARVRLAWLLQAGQFVAGLFAVWLFFDLCGRALVSLPTQFHDGSLWNIYDGGDE